MRVEVVMGVEGPCLVVDGVRVAGPKPWGGGRVDHVFEVAPTALVDPIKHREQVIADVVEWLRQQASAERWQSDETAQDFLKAANFIERRERE